MDLSNLFHFVLFHIVQIMLKPRIIIELVKFRVSLMYQNPAKRVQLSEMV